MSDLLYQLQNSLVKYTPSPSSLHCVSIFKCYKLQQLQRIPFNQPTLLMVTQGKKEVKTTNMLINQGDFFLVPADTNLRMNQHPDQVAKQYLAMALRFDFEALNHFRTIYGSSLDQWDVSPKWQSKASDDVLTALIQWATWENNGAENLQLIHHRQVELLLMLAHEGLVGNILLSEHPSWKQRVSQLLAFDPAHSWKIDEVCSRLAVSESSLRRKLQAEESTFRDLLEEVRLVTGLTMLTETQQSIGQIAISVGYQSQSRFGERFKIRFGMTPSDLRHTLISDV